MCFTWYKKTRFQETQNLHQNRLQVNLPHIMLSKRWTAKKLHVTDTTRQTVRTNDQWCQNFISETKIPPMRTFTPHVLLPHSTLIIFLIGSFIRFRMGLFVEWSLLFLFAFASRLDTLFIKFSSRTMLFKLVVLRFSVTVFSISFSSLITFYCFLNGIFSDAG